MTAGILLRLTIVLALGAWGIAAAEEAEQGPRTYRIDWPGHGITAVFEYKTMQLFQPQSVCVGKVSIENYGNRNYTMLLFKVSVFSATKELIATDRFSLTSNFGPGRKEEIQADHYNPLDPIVITQSFSECPKEMRWARVILDAF